MTLSGAVDAEGNSITAQVTGVSQDEAIAKNGDASTDARLTDQPDAVELRADRDPRGDGRVYHVSFDATDSNGGSCTGEVTLGVRRHKDSPATDSGPPLYDSLAPQLES